MTSDRLHCRGGFLLFETLLGVALFALAMLALGRCVGSCVDGEEARRWDAAARVALDNRRSEIEAGAVAMDPKREVLRNDLALVQTHTPLAWKDEQGKSLDGLSEIRLEASWKCGSVRQSKTLAFYVLEKN